jgi:hypothetical protein
MPKSRKKLGNGKILLEDEKNSSEVRIGPPEDDRPAPKNNKING